HQEVARTEGRADAEHHDQHRGERDERPGGRGLLLLGPVLARLCGERGRGGGGEGGTGWAQQGRLPEPAEGIPGAAAGPPGPVPAGAPRAGATPAKGSSRGAGPVPVAPPESGSTVATLRIRVCRSISSSSSPWDTGAARSSSTSICVTGRESASSTCCRPRPKASAVS